MSSSYPVTRWVQRAVPGPAIAEFVDDHGVGLHQLAGEISGPCLLFLPLQLVDQVDGVEEAHAFGPVDGGDCRAVR
jgi:hypothetical protein